MNTFRNTISWICLYLVGVAFFLTAVTFAFFSVVNPGTIKSALTEENVYTNVVPAVLKTTANTNVSTSQIPLKEPWVQTAAEKAFPASDIEQKTNTVIDSTFAWLDGTTDKPDFSIDLSSNKAAFSEEVGNYAKTRYEGLPACNRSNIPDSTDPLTITCRVPGVSSASAASIMQQRVLSDKNFLQNPVITSNNASLNPANQKINSDPFDQLGWLRTIYQNKTLLRWLLPVITIALAAAGLLLAMNRVNGLKRLMRTFILAAFSLLILGFVVGVGLGRAIDTFSIDAITSNVIEPVTTNLGHHAQRVYFIFAGIAVIVAIGSYIGSRMLRNVQKAQQPTAPVDRDPFGPRPLS